MGLGFIKVAFVPKAFGILSHIIRITNFSAKKNTTFMELGFVKVAFVPKAFGILSHDIRLKTLPQKKTQP
jgi:uncharacterized membrane protein